MLKSLVDLLNSSAHDHWQIEDFAAIDQLHTGGLAATQKLLQWLPYDKKNSDLKGLDIGCGLGGCSRMIASQHPYIQMTGTDINEDYIQAARLINKTIKPLLPCEYTVANSLNLPFNTHQFDFIISQHSMMPIKDKALLIAQVDRVLKPGGILLMHEIFLAPEAKAQAINYPMPWADSVEFSALHTWQDFNNLIKPFDFKLVQFNHDTLTGLDWMRHARQQAKTAKSKFTPSLILGSDAGLKSQHLANALAQGNLEIHSAYWHKLDNTNRTL